MNLNCRTSTVAVALATASPAQADPACQNGGVYILWARGSGQPIGDVEAQRFQSNVEGTLNATGIGTHAWAELGNLDGDVAAGQQPNDPANEYPAVPVNDWHAVNVISGNYADSVLIGVSELISNLNHRYTLGPIGMGCTSETVILGGYSQGADVIGTALAITDGGGLNGYPLPALTPEARSHIGFVAEYGDPELYSWDCPRPQWVRGDVGCNTIGFLGSRPPTTDMIGRYGSWCDQGDGICNDHAFLPGSHGTAYRNSWIQQSASEVVQTTQVKRCQLTGMGCSFKSLLQVVNTGSGWSAYNLTASSGRFIKGAPSVVWNGQMVGFGVTPDGRLAQFTLCPGGGAWCYYDLLAPGAMAGGVRAVMHGSAYEVFGPSADGSLLQIENTGSGWAAYNLSASNGVKIDGAPGVIWGSGSPTIYAVGTDNKLRLFYVNAGVWTPWVIPVGSQLFAGGVWAAQIGANVELFARGFNGHMYQVECNSSGVWSVYDIAPATQVTGSPGVIWDAAGPHIYTPNPWGALVVLSVYGGAWHTDAVLSGTASTGGADVIQVGSSTEIFTASW